MPVLLWLPLVSDLPFLSGVPGNIALPCRCYGSGVAWRFTFRRGGGLLTGLPACFPLIGVDSECVAMAVAVPARGSGCSGGLTWH